MTILALVLQPGIPPKKFVLHPLSETTAGIYGPEGNFRWTDEDAKAWRCEFEQKQGSTPCGLILYWGALDLPARSAAPRRAVCSDASRFDETCAPGYLRYPLDFSSFEGINVKIHYEGRARWLDIKLNNFEPELAAQGKLAEKPMTVLVHTTDLKAGAIFIKFSEFLVHDWWIWENDIPQHLAPPEFDGVVSLSIENHEPGVHNTRIDSVELVGEHLKRNDLLIILVVLWLAYLIFEALFGYFRIYHSARRNAEAIRQLKQEAKTMEQENVELEVQGVTDTLSGALNRAGLLKEIEPYYQGEVEAEFGLMVIDIDHFKRINDNYGHDAGDQIIKTLAELISNNIRDVDIFARWGGEEFLLFCPQTNLNNLLRIGEKLRALVASYGFPQLAGSGMTISIGVAAAKPAENFSETFKRADAALYSAKVKRNCVVSKE